MARALSEDNLVRRIERAFRTSRSRALRLGLRDDAALWRPSRGHELILTCDQFLEGSHFLRDKHAPDLVAWKCLGRAVSDIAAMGGKPKSFLLSLALPASLTGRWFGQFLAGLSRASRKWDCQLAGGDTTERKEILINVTVIGEVRSGYAVLRSGARPGNVLFVSGVLGEADLGLRLLRQPWRRDKAQRPSTRLGRVRVAQTMVTALQKHLCPEPRIALGQWLAEHRLATAMMDLSDGLSSDLPRLCAASGVGARIELLALPRVSGIDRAESIALALNGGDDYELLFTVPASKIARVPRKFGRVALTPIGRITRQKTLAVVDEDGKERTLTSRGWDPFRR